MENFVVSARKYRPITFESVVGQKHITTTLKNAIKSNQLAQAFLFTGPRGVGKTTCARILAKTINCLNVTENTEPCNSCTSCKNFDQNASFNIHELDAASNNSVEDIRNLIDQVRFPPQDGKYKVYIIDEVHMLSASAFNAFLKTLEEPPSYAIFILATTEKHKILPTILSRCQIFDFNRIQTRDMSEHLTHIASLEKIECEPEALELIAQKADGGLRDALSMFDLNVTFSADRRLLYKNVLENLHVLDYDYYLKMLDELYAGNISEVLLLLNEIISKGFDAHQFIVGLNEHCRNILVCKDPQTIELLDISESIKVKYLAQAKNISVSFLLSALSVGSSLDINYKAAKNQRLHIEIGLLKLSQINAVLNLANLPNGNGSVIAVPENASATITIPTKNDISTVVSSNLATKVGTKPSLKKLKSLKDLEAEITSEKLNDKSVAHNTTDLKTPFTKEEAESTLVEFAKTRASHNEKMVAESTIEKKDNLLTFNVLNKLQFDIFQEIKQELTDFLRNNLKNRNIEIDVFITAKESKAKPRTEQEKYEAMLAKNPQLKNLKDTLGLDLLF